MRVPTANAPSLARACTSPTRSCRADMYMYDRSSCAALRGASLPRDEGEIKPEQQRKGDKGWG